MGKKHPKSAYSKSVTKGRPPLAKSQNPVLSAKATRTLIRSHHNLRKVHAAALASQDAVKAASVEAEIAAQGGLESYQLASTIGQSINRGGDSSKVFIEWLEPLFKQVQTNSDRLRMLEVGALSTQNACSKVQCLDIDRIDLHSQAPEIREIDFMDLPVPCSEADKYHVVSLSLVLNFVPEASARGEMLKRIPKFLRSIPDVADSSQSYLFFVLPLPCVENARYMNEKRLNAIMQSLGFAKAHVKKTAKLYYSLWRYDESGNIEKKFGKEELNPGRSRNNFAIVIR